MLNHNSYTLPVTYVAYVCMYLEHPVSPPDYLQRALATCSSLSDDKVIKNNAQITRRATTDELRQTCGAKSMDSHP